MVFAHDHCATVTTVYHLTSKYLLNITGSLSIRWEWRGTAIQNYCKLDEIPVHEFWKCPNLLSKVTQIIRCNRRSNATEDRIPITSGEMGWGGTRLKGDTSQNIAIFPVKIATLTTTYPHLHAW